MYGKDYLDALEYQAAKQRVREALNAAAAELGDLRQVKSVAHRLFGLLAEECCDRRVWPGASDRP